MYLWRAEKVYMGSVPLRQSWPQDYSHSCLGTSCITYFVKLAQRIRSQKASLKIQDKFTQQIISNIGQPWIAWNVDLCLIN